MPPIRKRRAVGHQRTESTKHLLNNRQDQVDTESADSPRPNNRRQRPREDADSPDVEMSDNDTGASTPSNTDALVKKLVRLALASEYSRLPIRRPDIKDKVLGEHGARDFKTVFEMAQNQLRSVFGMEMSELPAREKVTVAQRRGECSLRIRYTGMRPQHEQQQHRIANLRDRSRLEIRETIRLQ